VIWSATSMKWIDEKMKLLGVTNNTKYKIAFHLDSLSMISVHTKKYGVIEVRNVFTHTCSVKKGEINI
jgi:ubiquitin-like domain-containing CTD phosphatase 1